jgi:hypothetical protein
MKNDGIASLIWASIFMGKTKYVPEETVEIGTETAHASIMVDLPRHYRST